MLGVACRLALYPGFKSLGSDIGILSWDVDDTAAYICTYTYVSMHSWK